MYQGNVGDNSSLAYLVPIYVPPGQSVTVKNVAGASVSHHVEHHAPPAGTLTVGQSTTYSAPFFINTPGITTITLTGPGY